MIDRYAQPSIPLRNEGSERNSIGSRYRDTEFAPLSDACQMSHNGHYHKLGDVSLCVKGGGRKLVSPSVVSRRFVAYVRGPWSSFRAKREICLSLEIRRTKAASSGRKGPALGTTAIEQVDFLNEPL